MIKQVKFDKNDKSTYPKWSPDETPCLARIKGRFEGIYDYVLINSHTIYVMNKIVLLDKSKDITSEADVTDKVTHWAQFEVPDRDVLLPLKKESNE